MGKNIDSLIKDILEEEFDNIEYPPDDEIWEQIRLKLNQERRKILLRKLRPVFLIDILISVVSFLLKNFKMYVIAFVNKIIRNMGEFTGNTSKIHTKVSAQDDKGGVDIRRNIDDPRIGEAQRWYIKNCQINKIECTF